jgi:hypothetical protein
VSESNDHNLIGFIANTVEKLRDEMATMRSNMITMQRDMTTMQRDMVIMQGDTATMRREMATKQDLARLEGRLSEKLDATATALCGEIEQVHLRLDTIQHGMSSRFEHFEGQLSRVRSAVYILGKDRPDVLRLLGQING